MNCFPVNHIIDALRCYCTKSSKHFRSFIFISIITLVLPGYSLALSIVAGTPLVYDSATDLYWYSRLTDFKGKTVDEIESFILPNISIPGYNNFHLASENDVLSLIVKYSYPFTVNPIFLQAFTPTSGTNRYDGINSDKLNIGSAPFNLPYPSHLVTWVIYNESINAIEFWTWEDYCPDNVPVMGAWVVGSKAESSPVPEPSTFLLLTVGILCGCILRMRIGRRSQILDKLRWKQNSRFLNA